MLFFIKLYCCSTAVHFYNSGGLKRLGLKKRKIKAEDIILVSKSTEASIFL